MEYMNSGKGCQMKAIGGNVHSVPISFAISQNHPLFKNLTRAMLKINENGKIDRIMEQYEQFRCQQKKPIETHPHPMEPADIAGLFAVVGVKIVVAVVWGIIKWSKRLDVRGKPTTVITPISALQSQSD